MMEGHAHNQEPEMKKIEGSDSWLGGPEIEEVPTSDVHEENLTEKLPPEVGFDGLEYKIPKPRGIFEENNEDVPVEAEEIPEYVEDVAKMMLPVLQISISRGIAGGWDSKAKTPTKDFIEVEGADLEKAVKNIHEPSLKRKEECMVYELIKNEISAQTEQERIIRDALIKRASRYCPN